MRLSAPVSWMATMALSMATLATVNGDINSAVLDAFRTSYAETIMNEYVLISQKTATEVEQSTEYRWNDLVEAYDFMINSGISQRKMLVGQSEEAALINLAMFLAQAMKETIKYNACDENNWSINLRVPDYPITAACGQEKQDYMEYHCSAQESYMECPVDPQMAVQAKTMAAWGGAPPPLFCAPRSMTGDKLPRWAYNNECGPAGYADVPEFPEDYIKEAVFEGVNKHECNAYEGQFSGYFTYGGCDSAKGCANTDAIDTAGGKIHYDVEGCCWWGRGVIQTTGPCNVGKLNYYLTGTRYDGGQPSKDPSIQASYPDLNLCTAPNLICDGPPELKWISGMFYWVFDVQGYENKSKFPNYDFEMSLNLNAVKIFDDPSSAEARNLVDMTSGLVNRGCPALFCQGAGNVHEPGDRFNNFKKALSALRHIYNPTKYSLTGAGNAAQPARGKWYTEEALCSGCSDGQCGLKYSLAMNPSCVNWAKTPDECQAASTVGAKLCGIKDSGEVVAVTPAPQDPQASPTSHPTTLPDPEPTSAPTEDVGETIVDVVAPSNPVNEVIDVPQGTPTDAAGMCTGCFHGTAGPCKSSNTVCWPFWDSDGNCPPGTILCADMVGGDPWTPPSQPGPGEGNGPITEVRCTGCTYNTDGPCQDINTRVCIPYENEEHETCLWGTNKCPTVVVSP